MQKNSKIYIAGHRGLLGSAITRALQKQNYANLLCRTSAELDLLDTNKTFEFFEAEKPEYVFVSAAKVGGIQANAKALGLFLYQNIQIQTNVIEAARRAGVKKLLFVASTCIYPVNAVNPIDESQLLTGPFESTNEGYAVAKLAGVKMCELYRKQYQCNFITSIPCNLFGLNDHYDAENAHVLQSLIRKVHEAKLTNQRKIVLWGSGAPRREFLLSEDCADALVFMMENYNEIGPLNIGTGIDHSIIELAQAVSKVLDYPVDFEFDKSKPDGIFRKLSDVTKIQALGWHPKNSLEDGIKIAYGDFLRQLK